MKTRITSTAKAFLSDIIEFYNKVDDEQGTSLASMVFLAVNDTISRILVSPKAGFPYDKALKIYRSLTEFHIGIFYTFTEEELVILAIVDLRQNPAKYLVPIKKLTGSIKKGLKTPISKCSKKL